MGLEGRSTPKGTRMWLSGRIQQDVLDGLNSIPSVMWCASEFSFKVNYAPHLYK